MTPKRSAVLISMFASILLSSVLARVAGAQATGVTNSTSVPIPGVGHDYIEAFNEVTDPTNGSVSLRLAVPTPPGRGISLPFSFNYDTQGVYAVDPTSGINLGNRSRVPSYLNLNGWSYSVPKLTIQENAYEVKNGRGQSTCFSYNNLTLLDLSGVSRIFPIQSVSQKPYCAGTRQNLTGGDVSFVASIPSGSGVAAGVLVAGADGTTYSWPGSVSHEEGLGCGTACYFDYVATKIEDRNGNQINLTDLNNGAFTASDTLGRVVLSSSGFGASGNTVTVSGLGGPYTVSWGTVGHNFPLTFTLLENLDDCPAGPTTSQGSSSGITAITLPNGKQYSLTYDPTYGLVSKLTYPTGGWIEYTWGLNSQAATAWLENQQGVANRCLWRFDKPALAHRYVSYDGTNIAQQQDFKYSTSWETTDFGQAWISKQTIVTTHDLVRGTSFVTTYVYTGGRAAEPFDPGPNSQFSDDQLPVEQTITYQDTNGGTLKTVAKTWINTEQLSTEQVTLDSGQSSKIVYAYGAGGQVTEKDEYDFGQSSPTRKTSTSYQTFPATPIFQSGPSLFNRPCQTITTGTGSAETDYLYDGGATVCGTPGTTSVATVSGLPEGTHDETNYASSSTAPRGNLTSLTKKCSPSCSSAVETFAYDETGQTVSMTDPCGNSTCSDIVGSGHTATYSYADSYSVGTPPGNTNAYLTQVTKPTTNGFSHISKYSYSYADGKLTTQKDENGQPTTYAYADSLDRLTNVVYPDGGQTSFTYNDGPPAPSVTTTTLATPDPTIVSVRTIDGLGHTIQTEITSATPPIFTNTSYDGLGRVYTVSNPHASTGGPTDGTVTYTYDPLGRIKILQKQDGSIVSTAYAGNTTTVTDEAGNKSESVMDALGRVTTAFEPDSSNNLSVQTTYTYDELDDLLSVLQDGSHGRSFAYDSLSRLTSSANPETNTLAYAYDANGNVSTKSDARGTTTTYSYDQLNRAVQKLYSDGTPTASFLYDVSSTNGVVLSNTLGRLSRSNTSIVESLYSYDSVGRVSDYIQTTPQHSSMFNLLYSYNLAGKAASFSNGLGVTFSYSIDGAGRTTILTSSLSTPPQYPGTLATVDPSVGFYPNGAIRKITFGNGITETSAFNSRLQPCRINVNSSATALGSCTDAIPSGSIQDYNYGFSFGAGDNGNLRAWVATGQQNFTRSYSYDHLNQLSTMADTASSQPCKGLSWVYDVWANRTGQNVTSGSCLAPQTPVNSNNQLTVPGYTYDLAGNVTHDATHSYAYDAENRLTQVDGGSTASYTYGADGHRVEKTTAAGHLDYLYDLAGNVSGEWIASTGFTGANAHYVYMDGRLVAEYVGSTTYFVHKDHLGSTRLMTGVTQNIVDNMDYLPFGEQIAGGSGTTHKFASTERDSESNLDNFKARYMASSLGRFMSPDWSSKPQGVPYAVLTAPQSLNLYTYVQNNPLTNVDPTGHWCFWGFGDSCPAPKPSTSPATMGTIFSYIHKLSGLEMAIVSVGNNAQHVSDLTKVSASGQLGNMGIDTNGQASIIVGVPALAASTVVDINGPGADQVIIAQPSTPAGGVLGFGSDFVEDPNGQQHFQGFNFSLGLSTPNPFPSVAVPYRPDVNRDDTWQNNGDIKMIDDFEPVIEP
jgi:RHS repeat-associated protein